MTHLRAQHHIADLQRAADRPWLAAMTNAKPAKAAKPRRTSVRRRWIALSLLTDRR
jgi:hypothetical protein